MDILEKLKQTLKKKGFKEQKCKTIYINGEYATNFYKNGEVIHISYNTWADKETLQNLKM